MAEVEDPLSQGPIPAAIVLAGVGTGSRSLAEAGSFGEGDKEGWAIGVGYPPRCTRV